MLSQNTGFILASVCVILAVLLQSGHCDDDATTKSTPTKSGSDISTAHGLDRLKLLAALRKQNASPAALHSNEQRESQEKLQDGHKDLRTDEEPGSLTNTHVKLSDDENEGRANNADVRLRSNSSSHVVPLSVDRHQKKSPSGGALLSKSNSNSTGIHEQIAHEQTLKFRVHANSDEEDSAEDASFKAPVSGAAHGKIADPDTSSAVRTSPNSRPALGINSANKNSGIGRIVQLKKPLPVVRQEAGDQKTSDHPDSSHDE